MKKIDLIEFRVRNVENFLKRKWCSRRDCWKKIDVRKLPGNFLDCLLNGVEACQEGSKKIGASIQREYSIH